MSEVRIEFDADGNAENDLAQIWIDAPVGERERIGASENDAEDRLKVDPDAGILITNGVHPPVRYLDAGLLRTFYQYHESHKKIIIIGFRRAP
jgi:hypothetical protein